MNFITLLLAGALNLIGLGNTEANFVKVEFGTDRGMAIRQLEQQFGKPDTVSNNALIYYNRDWAGYRFDKIIFGFESSDKGGYFNQARFFIMKPTRKQAVEERDSLAKQLSQHHGITCDYEENGNKFYKGGVSPTGIGHLFTVYTQKREGKWATELRFGAFHKLKKKQ